MSKAADPNKLANHLDHGWATKKSEIRHALERSKYTPVYSWDGMSDESVSFSRLKSNDIPYQHSHPCTLSGKRIIELEKNFGMSAITGAEITKGSSQLPLSFAQKDVGVVGTDLSGTVPIALTAHKENKCVIMEKNYAFENYDVKPPVFKIAEIPSFYAQAGSNGDRILLNPTQRKQIMIHDTEVLAAKKHIQAAQCERHKLKTSLLGPTHHRGVLMYDSVENVNSEAYGSKAVSQQEYQQKWQEHKFNREENIKCRSGGLTTNFNDLVSKDTPQNDFMQSKNHSKISNNLSYGETSDRLFHLKNDIKPANQGRMQELRNRDISGKKYDIVLHTDVVHCPSNIPEKQNKTLFHPSQTSLNSVRNLQGSLLK